MLGVFVCLFVCLLGCWVFVLPYFTLFKINTD